MGLPPEAIGGAYEKNVGLGGGRNAFFVSPKLCGAFGDGVEDEREFASNDDVGADHDLMYSLEGNAHAWARDRSRSTSRRRNGWGVMCVGSPEAKRRRFVRHVGGEIPLNVGAGA